jgi:hypothetical protein
MKNTAKNKILLQILKELNDQELTVTGVRNELMRNNHTFDLDKSSLRRWVNSRFVTLSRKGILTPHTKENTKKTFFRVNHQHPDLFSIPPLQTTFPQPKTNLPTKLCDAASDLKEDLETLRLTALTQVSEIDEYKRISQTYPHLKGPVLNQFALALNENCRTLGKIKAIETLLNATKIA